METFTEDSEYIMQMVGFKNYFYVNEMKSRKNEQSVDDYMLFYTKVSPDLLVKLYTIIKRDLFLFEYKLPTFFIEKIRHEIIPPNDIDKILLQLWLPDENINNLKFTQKSDQFRSLLKQVFKPKMMYKLLLF